jgi:hypothetical protein
MHTCIHSDGRAQTAMCLCVLVCPLWSQLHLITVWLYINQSPCQTSLSRTLTCLLVQRYLLTNASVLAYQYKSSNFCTGKQVRLQYRIRQNWERLSPVLSDSVLYPLQKKLRKGHLVLLIFAYKWKYAKQATCWRWGKGTKTSKGQVKKIRTGIMIANHGCQGLNLQEQQGRGNTHRDRQLHL